VAGARFLAALEMTVSLGTIVWHEQEEAQNKHAKWINQAQKPAIAVIQQDLWLSEIQFETVIEQPENQHEMKNRHNDTEPAVHIQCIRRHDKTD
jgi:hypothetical protein